MKVLVAGSSGLVGSNLIRHLQAQGDEVKRLVRRWQNLNEDEIGWNPETGVIHPNDLEGFDAVVNLAGENIAEGRWNDEKKQKILDSRVKTTRTIAVALAGLKQPPKVFINASAIGYYGSQSDTLLDESNPNGNGFLASVCHEWECAAAAAQRQDIRVVFLRIGLVLASGGGVLEKILTPFKMGAGGMIGNGSQYMSWIAIDDLTAIIHFIINKSNLKGPINAVSPNPVTNEAFTKVLGHIIKRPTIMSLPAFAARLMFGREMADETILSSCRVTPKKLIDADFVFQYPTLEAALTHYVQGD